MGFRNGREQKPPVRNDQISISSAQEGSLLTLGVLTHKLAQRVDQWSGSAATCKVHVLYIRALGLGF